MTSPYYSLWDIEGGNSLGTYETKDEVLDVARALIDANGPEFADLLDVSLEDADGNLEHVASGESLRALTGTRHPTVAN
jgi:hypothetical protein